MVNAGGAAIPEGYGPEEVARLQAILGTRDQSAQDTYANLDMGEYNPDAWQQGQAPARLTDLPTSSLSASRPRTVAAGYDKNRQLMTVMFRDGTLINYYDISPGDWENFHNSISKGRPWLNRGFPNSPNSRQKADGQFVKGNNFGPADLTNVPANVLEDIYRIARSSQVRYKNSRTIKHTLPGAFGGGTVRSAEDGYVPKAARAKAQYAPRSATSRSISASKQNKSANRPRKP
jgi:hypothetical protein